MSDHLPECIHPQRDYPCAWCQEIDCECPCICDRLLAAEQRVKDGWTVVMLEAWDRGFNRGLREGSNAVQMLLHDEPCDCEPCRSLAAVDLVIERLLKEKK